MKSLSRVRLFATPWTVGAYHAPLSVGFSRQEYWRVAVSFSRVSSVSGPCRPSCEEVKKSDALSWQGAPDREVADV